MTAMQIAAAAAMGSGLSLAMIDGSTISQITFSAGSTSCSAGVELQSDGDVAEMRGDGLSFPSTRTLLEKYASTGVPYEVRATLNSGDTPVGTLSSWLALTSTRSWYLTDTGSAPRSKSCSLTIAIRPAGGGSILESATLTLSIQIDSI